MKIKAKEKPGIVQQRQSKAIRRTAMEKLSGDLIAMDKLGTDSIGKGKAK